MSRYRNCTTVAKDYYSLFFGGIVALLLGIIIEYFTDRALIVGNFGRLYASINLVVDIINIILIWGFVASFVYKRRLFGTSSNNNQSGWFGSFTAVLVSGCPSCSITLASYLGLASVLSLLPYNGLELKIVGTILLLWSLYTNIRDLTICKRK